LHQEDKEILLAGNIAYQHLITIRKGESAYNPITARVEPVLHELIKVGSLDGNNWSCRFFRAGDASCEIYADRPLECRLLKCWDTAALMPVIGKDTLARTEIINPADPIIPLFELHNRECACRDIDNLVAALAAAADSEAESACLAGLTEFVRRDLTIRAYAHAELGLPAAVELFVFGRPVFILLRARGLSVREAEDGLVVLVDEEIS